MKAQPANTVDSIADRVPPQALEAEQTLLGCIMINPEVMNELVDQVQPAHFYRTAHDLIYRAILDLYNKNEPIDIVTVSEELKAKDLLVDVGGRSYVSELALAVATPEVAPYMARKIREMYLLRQAINIGTNMVYQAYEGDDADHVLEYAEQQMFKLSQQQTTNDVVDVTDVMPGTYEMIESRFNNPGGLLGLSTGFYDLDKITCGLQPSDLIIVAARPSMGKTAFALNIATNVVLKEEQPVLVFSLEMSKEQLTQRVLCAHAEVDAQRVKTGDMTPEDFEAIANAMGDFQSGRLLIDDSAGLSVMELRAKARRIKREKGLGMIVVDYLQLMEEKGVKGSENRVQVISAISRGLKNVARELHVPVIALSQLSRNVESRQDKKPMLSDLRESGSIEQDADLVAFLYRDEYYNPDTPKPGVTEVIIAKQRNGPTGMVELLFKHTLTKFLNKAERIRF